jgi:hypothetical protein
MKIIYSLLAAAMLVGCSDSTQTTTNDAAAISTPAENATPAATPAATDSTVQEAKDAQAVIDAIGADGTITKEATSATEATSEPIAEEGTTPVNEVVVEDGTAAVDTIAETITPATTEENVTTPVDTATPPATEDMGD